MDNKNYFYISGILSVSLFAFFAFMMVYMLFSTTKLKVYGLKKENYISVSIALPKVKTSKRRSRKKKHTSATLKSSKKTVSKNLDINDLFSDVWTKDIKKISKKKKKLEKRFLDEIQKKTKLLDSNSSKIVNKDDEYIEDSTKEEHTESVGNEINEYHAKIQALVYDNFKPPPNSQGYVVKAVIELSAIGKVMDFRILEYSQNAELNKESDRMKSRLMKVLFPVNPQNKPFMVVINLIPENKE